MREEVEFDFEHYDNILIDAYRIIEVKLALVVTDDIMLF